VYRSDKFLQQCYFREDSVNDRTDPANTKLLICVWNQFSELRPKPLMADALRRRWPQMNVVHLPNYDNLLVELADTDIFVGYSLRADQLAAAKRLKWLHSTAAGVAQLIYPELRACGIPVTTASGVFSSTMAEHIIGMMLCLARNFPDVVRQQDRTLWSQQQLWDKPQHLTELNEKLLLIIGYGSIGREVAKRAAAFGMRIWGVTRSGKGDSTHSEKIVSAQELHAVLPEADYVLICTPETAETKHLIGAEEITRMKPGTRLLNVGRGSLLDESALIPALKSGALAGAALDVAEAEPLPPESPLWRSPNIFITPHVSGVSDRMWERETTLLIELLERWFSGRELLNLVDFDRGY
jgi:phosphoglycerate dehydrogenase-like enzyme